MRVSTHIGGAEAAQVLLATDAIVLRARAELEALGHDASTAPSLTMAIDLLELATASAGQLVAKQSENARGMQ